MKSTIKILEEIAQRLIPQNKLSKENLCEVDMFLKNVAKLVDETHYIIAVVHDINDETTNINLYCDSDYSDGMHVICESPNINFNIHYNDIIPMLQENYNTNN